MKQTRSAGGIVLNNDGEVLVVNQNGDSWSLPKGHVEKGETDLECAIREIREEAGVGDLLLLKDLGSYERHRLGRDGKDDPLEKKTIHLFLFQAKSSKLSLADPHTPDARWVKKDEVSQLLTHPKDREYYLEVTQGL